MSTQQKSVMWSLIVLLAADEHTSSAIASELDIHFDTVRTWRRAPAKSWGVDAVAPCESTIRRTLERLDADVFDSIVNT